MLYDIEIFKMFLLKKNILLLAKNY